MTREGPGRAGATYLIPAYESCPRGVTTTTTLIPPPPCVPATRESSFTFDSAVLKTSAPRYIAGGKVAFVLLLSIRKLAGVGAARQGTAPANR